MRISQLTAEARSHRPPLQRWLDTFSERYSQAVVAAAAAVAVLGPVLFGWPLWCSPGGGRTGRGEGRGGMGEGERGREGEREGERLGERGMEGGSEGRRESRREIGKGAWERGKTAGEIQSEGEREKREMERGGGRGRQREGESARERGRSGR